MKEPDVSSWSREELEAAYKQSQKNVAARGQSLAHAQKKIAELEKQLEGWQPDEVEQTIQEQAQKIEQLGKELDELKEARERMIKYVDGLEQENDKLEEELKRRKDCEAFNQNTAATEDTVIIVKGTRPQMMTVYFNGEEEADYISDYAQQEIDYQMKRAQTAEHALAMLAEQARKDGAK